MNKKRRKIAVTIGAILAVFVAFFLYTRFYGCTLFTRHTIGHSDIYTKSEIKSAMHVVENEFHSTFKECYLTKLWYDEDASTLLGKAYEEHYEGKQVIVLLSNYYAGFRAEGSLGPNSTYDEFSWILVRTNGGDWELKSWGY